MASMKREPRIEFEAPAGVFCVAFHRFHHEMEMDFSRGCVHSTNHFWAITVTKCSCGNITQFASVFQRITNLVAPDQPMLFGTRIGRWT